MTTGKLPAQFADLEPFLERWGLETEQERYARLHESTIDELRAFFEAIYPRVDEIVAYLNRYERGAMPEEAKRLYFLTMTFTETSHPIDLGWKDVDFTDAYNWRAFGFKGVSAAPND